MLKKLNDQPAHEIERWAESTNSEMSLLFEDLREFHSGYSSDAILMTCAATIKSMLIDCDTKGEIYQASIEHAITEIVEGISKYIVKHDKNPERVRALRLIIEKRYGN